MLERLSQLNTLYPRRVIGFWLVLFLLSIPFAGQLDSVLNNDPGLAPNSETERFVELIESEFVSETNYQLILTAEAKDDSASLKTLIEDLELTAQQIAELDSVKEVKTAQTEALIPNFEETRKLSLALIALNSNERDSAVNATRVILAGLATNDHLDYNLTGWPVIEHELQKVSQEDAKRAELIGLSLSLIVLFLVFGAVVAATLPILVAIMSISLSLAVLFFVGQVYPIASFGQLFVSLLGLATGIDYALLIVNRFREELEKGSSVQAAAKQTTLSAGKAVTVSGLTVLIALAALLIPPLAFIRSMGIASVTALFFSLAISITALPALLTLLGHNVNKFRLSRRPPGTRTREFWRQRAYLVMRRPWLWTSLGLGLLILLSLPALRIQVDFGGTRSIIGESNINQAASALSKLELDSLQRSIDVLIPFEDEGFFHPSNVRSVSQLTRTLSDLDNVDFVLSPLTTTGVPRLLVFQYYATQQSAISSPLKDLAQATVSKTGSHALIRIFPSTDNSPMAISQLIETLKNNLADQELSGILSGPYVIDREWAAALYGSFPLAIFLVYTATFILLGLAFRSLLIPLKSIILNTLGLGAAFGFITAVFQLGWFAPLVGLAQGLGFIETSVPIFIFAIVFGLSMDYEVFLVSRIYEGHRKGMSDREAVAYALSLTGNVISSAALIMVVVFVSFIFSQVVLIKTLSLGLTVAIILDATLIRSVLVPAVMSLAGRWNWWLPKPIANLAERFDFSHD